MAHAILGSLNASTPSIASSTTALAANQARVGFIIQNLGQNPLFMKLGSGASTTVFTSVMKAGTTNDDGTGGSFSMQGDGVWQGILSIAGTSPRYSVTEFQLL
jgi:hypothetical protein